MKNRTVSLRRPARSSLRWLMLYGDGEFVAKGTVLSIAANVWRVAGPMPVHPGMRLKLRVWPLERPDAVYVNEATVIWTKGFEFGLIVEDINASDQEWLTQYLDRALPWWLASQAA